MIFLYNLDQHEWELKLSPEEALRELQDNLYDIVTASYDANNPAADKESTGDHEVVELKPLDCLFQTVH